MRRNSIISIEIDEVTPCLRRLSDGAILQTKSYKLNRLPEHVDFSQWEFDWPELFSDGYAIYTIKAEGDYRMQGLIALQDEPQNSLIRLQNVESAPFNNRHNRKVEGQEYAGVGVCQIGTGARGNLRPVQIHPGGFPTALENQILWGFHPQESGTNTATHIP